MPRDERIILNEDPVEINAGRRKVTLTVSNTGDRPIQVGSHFHFFEANRYLDFDRGKAFGMHLDVAAGTAVRLEPGDTREVTLTEYGGARRIHGFNNLTNGGADCVDTRIRALHKAVKYRFKGARQDETENGQ